MITESSPKRYFETIGVIALFATLLFACTNEPVITPQSPVVKPTKTKSPQAPNVPESNNPPTKIFSIQNANKIPPDDIIQEIFFGGTGGGYPCDPTITYAQPTLVSWASYRNPARAEWLDDFGILSCGWDIGETVTLTIKFPDGTTTSKSLVVEINGDGSSSIGVIFFDHWSSLNDQIGNYSFFFEGYSGELQHNVTVYRGSGPRFYSLHNGDYQTVAYYLYGFSPQERVRLILYSSSGTGGKTRFTAWEDYQVDEKGELLINTTDSGGFFAVGDSSGVNQNTDINILSEQSSTSSSSSCAGALPSRLKIGEYAYVATDPPLDQRVRQGTGTNYSIIGYITPGNPMKILDGPKCADGWVWWKVQSIKKSDLIGWTSEGDDVYWLIPCNSLNSCP